MNLYMRCTSLSDLIFDFDISVLQYCNMICVGVHNFKRYIFRKSVMS